jgi:single-strand DNA-binding protein
MNETIITITGCLTTDPEVRFTSSGTAVANFTVASNPRRFDKATNGYVDAEPIVMRCTAWRTTAENVAESLTRGMRVIVTGSLTSNSWEDRETGAKRTSVEVNVTEVGVSLLWATVTVITADRATAAAGTPAGDDEPPF